MPFSPAAIVRSLRAALVIPSLEERKLFKAEFSVWFTLVWMLSISNACRLAMMLTDASILGHINTDYLAASSLANVWMLLSALILNGFGDAIRTLGSQAWGAGNHRLVGLWLQTGLVWITVLSIPIAGLWLATKPAMRLLGVSKEVAHLCQVYVNWSFLGLWPRGAFNALDAYLQTQGVVGPQLIISVIFVGVNFGLNWLLVHGGGSFGGLGFIGSPIATSLSTILQFLFLLLFMHRRKPAQKAWYGWSLECISKKRTKDYLSQAVPVALTMGVEEWQLDIIAGFAGHMGDVPIATHTSILQIFMWLSSIELGIQRATSVRVGHHLGNSDIPAAKRVVKIASIFAMVVALIVGTMWVICRKYVGMIFSSDPAVLHATARLGYVCGAAFFVICIFYVSLGVLEGQGRPLVAALAFVVGSWFVCLPLAYVFGFTLHLGLQGLWYAMVSGYAVVTTMALVGTVRGSWPDAVAAALARSVVLPTGNEPALEDGADADADADAKVVKGKAKEALVSVNIRIQTSDEPAPPYDIDADDSDTTKLLAGDKPLIKMQDLGGGGRESPAPLLMSNPSLSPMIARHLIAAGSPLTARSRSRSRSRSVASTNSRDSAGPVVMTALFNGGTNGTPGSTTLVDPFVLRPLGSGAGAEPPASRPLRTVSSSSALLDAAGRSAADDDADGDDNSGDLDV